MARILVAEDEHDIRQLVHFVLTFAGHEVFQAANGEEAVSLAQAHKPDLILLDVRMPRLTGYEACRKIKALDDMKQVPVVFLSAKGQDEEIATGLESGASAYILKPFSPEALTKQVNALLEQQANREADIES